MQERFTRDFAPVKVGEELDVKIEAVGEKGDGIAKVKGFVLFVPNTNEGDEVKYIFLYKLQTQRMQNLLKIQIKFLLNL